MDIRVSAGIAAFAAGFRGGGCLFTCLARAGVRV